MLVMIINVNKIEYECNHRIWKDIIDYGLPFNYLKEEEKSKYLLTF